MPSTFGTVVWSDELWHDGPAAAARFDHGDDGNSRGSEHVLATNGQLGNGYRPTDSILGLSQSVPVSGAVWRFELFLSRPLLTFLFRNLLLVFEVPPALGLLRLLGISIGHSRTQLTSVLDDGLYLGISPPITDLAPGSEEN